MKKDIRSLTFEELSGTLEAMGEKRYRAGQIYSWLHEKQVSDFEQMTNLSRPLRQKLADNFFLTVLEAVQVLTSKLDGTRKYLFRLSDGNVIESVWMEYHHGASVCISSQVGCRMGCRFCASTLDGPGAESGAVGDAGADLQNAGAYGAQDLQRSGHGIRRALR